MRPIVQSSDPSVVLRGSLWAIPVVVPLFVILISFFFGVWDWGLMDDHARVLYPIKFNPSDLVEFGLFRPTFSAYSAIFYRLFSDWVLGFYVFKLFFVSLTLTVWGFLAYRSTGEWISFWLVSAVTLSFHYFYDSIFYLSSHEVIGLFFLGIALHCFLPPITTKGNNLTTWLTWFLPLLGLCFLVLAFFSKEPFLSAGVAVGLSYFYVNTGWFLRRYKKNRNWNELLIGIVVIGTSLGYGLFLMVGIKGGYSSVYDPLNIGRVVVTLTTWIKKDFVNHLPWVLMMICILFSFSHPLTKKNARFHWIVVTAGFIYFGYLFLLLPWNTVGYYATPLGLFFGLFVSLVLAKALARLSVASQSFTILISLILNITVCLYALNRESLYQYDTSNLLQWARVSSDETKYDFSSVATNAIEPARAIPHLLQLKWSIKIPPFDFVRSPRPDKHQLFLYSPRFSSLENCQQWNYSPTVLSRIGVSEGRPVCYELEEYRVLMVSNNWIVFILKDDI